MAFSARQCSKDDEDVACSDVNIEKNDGKDISEHFFFLRKIQFWFGGCTTNTLKHKNATLHL